MAGTIDLFSYGKKMFFLMQNIFIVPAMQHGCCAKPLLIDTRLQIPLVHMILNITLKIIVNLMFCDFKVILLSPHKNIPMCLQKVCILICTNWTFINTVHSKVFSQAE